MKRASVILLATVGLVCAEDSRLQVARQALADGLPQVAVYQLQKNAQNWAAPEDAAAADLLLAQALFAAGRYSESAALLERVGHKSVAVDFWLAQSYAALGRTEAALALYQRVIPDQQWARSAVLGRARMLTALGRTKDAREGLVEFLKNDPGVPDLELELCGLALDAGQPDLAHQALSAAKDLTPEQQRRSGYLEGRILLNSGQAQQAEERFKQVIASNKLPADLAADVSISLADSQVAQNKDSDAEKTLEVFVEEYPGLPGLDRVFSALDQVYAREGASSSSELRKWSTDGKDPERSALALFYLARNEVRSSKADESRKALAEFLRIYPYHPLADEARAELAESLLLADRPIEALSALQGGKGARVAFLQGHSLAALWKYGDAANSFLQASKAPTLRLPALTNSAICGMLAGQPEAQNIALQQLPQENGGREIVEKIAYYRALHAAATRDPEAADLLQQIADQGSHYSQRAILALAEWDNLQLNTQSARAQLRRISSDDPSTLEKAEFLSIFLADLGDAESENQVIKLSEAFLKKHVQSRYEPEVRMKLGEMLYRRGDYLGARGQFNIITEEFPGTPLAEKAQFLTAQAMARSMDPNAMEEAIDEFETVAKSNGPLAVQASLAQAVLYNALKRPKDALGVLDGILADKPEPALRYTALIEKGDTFNALGSEDPANFRNAIAAWEEITKDPSAPKSWLYQAYVKMGAIHEKLHDADAALNCYYRVFSDEQKGVPEYFWYYKAGFAAGDLLESQKLWKEAIAVYEKIGSIDGPRAGEAADRVNKLRLENFIWEN